MKNFILLLFMVMCFFSCKNKYEKNLKKMDETIKREMLDQAFKDNCSIKFLEFKTVSYDTITQNNIDMMRISKKGDTLEFVTGLCKLVIKEMQQSTDKINMYREFGWNDLLQVEKRTANELIEKNNKYKSWAYRLSEEIEALGDSIKNRENPKLFFCSKTYVKAVVTQNNNKEAMNIADTAYRIFDTNLKMYK